MTHEVALRQVVARHFSARVKLAGLSDTLKFLEFRRPDVFKVFKAYADEAVRRSDAESRCVLLNAEVEKLQGELRQLRYDNDNAWRRL